MKKLLIASLIASTALSAVADETTLYGSIGYDVATGQTAKRFRDGGTKGRWNLDTDELTWGIKGEENINPNITAFWQLEFGEWGDGRLQGSSKTKKALVGLKGDSWGTLTLGSQDSLVKAFTDYNDIFDAVSFWGKGTKFNEQLDVPDRVISYVSPNWSGFSFGVAGILNGKDGAITDRGVPYGYNGETAPLSVGYMPYIDPKTKQTKYKKLGSNSFGAGQIGVRYENYGFYGALAYQYAHTDFDVEQVRDRNGNHIGNRFYSNGEEIITAAVGYSQDNFKVGITEKHMASDGDKVSIAGEYYYGPHTVRAGFGVANSKSLNGAPGTYNPDNLGKYCYNGELRCGSKEVYTYALGYKYNLSKRTYTYVEGLYADNNTKKYTYRDARGRKQTIRNPRRNEYEFKFGLRHDF